MYTKTFLTALSLFSSALSLPASSVHDHHDVHAHHSRNILPRYGAGSAVTVSAALDFYDPTFSDGSPLYSDPTEYQCFSGPASNFPARSQWSSFWDLFNLNQRTSMAPIGDTGAEQGAIYDAIVAVSQQSRVDARIILAIMVQESTANVRVGCTNNGVQNCGLMQSYNPSDTSYDPNNMLASITQMVRDGTQGTSGPGLVQLFNDGETSGNPYNVFRKYNSGSVDLNNLSAPKCATGSYVSDIANRLMGWNGNGNGRDKCGFWNGC